MSNTQHTPGPWGHFCDNSCGIFIVDRLENRVTYKAGGIGHYTEIASVDSLDVGTAEADARLIAAAPSMLDALQASKYVIDRYLMSLSPPELAISYENSFTELSIDLGAVIQQATEGKN